MTDAAVNRLRPPRAPATDDRWIDRGFSADVVRLWRQRRLGWMIYLANMAEHRRTSGIGMLAPFVSVLVHVLLLGSVMSLVFHESLTDFLPFFAISFAIWQSLNLSVSHSASSNERASRYLHFPNVSGQLIHLVDALDYGMALIFKLLAAALLILFVNPSLLAHANYLALLAGLVLMSAATLSWALPIAYVFDRVRLLKAFLPQMLYAIFLITPILWRPSRLQGHAWVVDFNPVFYLVEVVRGPLLDGEWPLRAIAVVGGLVLLGLAASLAAYRPNRNLMVFRWIA